MFSRSHSRWWARLPRPLPALLQWRHRWWVVRAMRQWRIAGLAPSALAMAQAGLGPADWIYSCKHSAWNPFVNSDQCNAS